MDAAPRLPSSFLKTRFPQVFMFPGNTQDHEIDRSDYVGARFPRPQFGRGDPAPKANGHHFQSNHSWSLGPPINHENFGRAGLRARHQRDKMVRSAHPTKNFSGQKIGRLACANRLGSQLRSQAGAWERDLKVAHLNRWRARRPALNFLREAGETPALRNFSGFAAAPRAHLQLLGNDIMAEVLPGLLNLTGFAKILPDATGAPGILAFHPAANGVKWVLRGEVWSGSASGAGRFSSSFIPPGIFKHDGVSVLVQGGVFRAGAPAPIRAVPLNPGFLDLPYRRGALRLINRMSGSFDVIATVKALKPAVEIKLPASLKRLWE